MTIAKTLPLRNYRNYLPVAIRTMLVAIYVISAPSSVAAAELPQRHIEYPTYFAHANGISIAYQDFGNPQDEVILLVMGLGAQLIHWKDEFVFDLVDAGYRVIRFDNRDAGWSEKLYDQSSPGIITGIRYKLGMSLGAPYHLDDMAADSIGLLDYLNIRKAHVAGISMGGMIAQIMTAKYPERIISLTSIMSSSGKKGLPEGTLKVETRDRDGLSRDEILQDIVKTIKAIYAKEGNISEQEWLARAARSYDRNHYDKGFGRQFWAIMDSGSREELLKSITQPSLVIHGALDPLIPLAHGEDTAELLSNSSLLVLDDMGHYMDTEHIQRVLDGMLPMMRTAAAK
jgi:pimeloyl-ACP methyl ester carboxylesterase